MEFKINKKKNPNVKNYHKDDLDIAYDFTKKIYKEFGNFLKGVVLFGSRARDPAKTGKGDIDILIVLDDISIQLSQEMLEAYKIITEKAVADTSRRLHITTMKFTTFFDLVRNGDPVGVNILREGVALIDTGFFDPLQILLNIGRIRPTTESIYTYYARAPKTLLNSRWHLLQATVDLYWAGIDACHAALMKIGEMPPSPQHVPELMEEKMVKRKLTDKRYVSIMRNLYKTMKMITHREIKEISGQEYDRFYKEAKDLVDEMKRIMDRK